MTSPTSCAIEQRSEGETTVVSVTGTVDMLTAPQLEQAIGAAARVPPPPWSWT